MATPTPLPPEIITEILTRLPIKSLSRFLTVNKSWYSLIKNPNFIKLHLKKSLISTPETYLILCDSSLYISQFNPNDIHSPISFSELHHPLEPANVDIIGSCNGILCISDITKNYVALFNPLTNSTRIVRPTRIRDFKTEWNDRVYYGFGYDSVTDDYKVLCYYQKFNNWEVAFCKVEVFSFKSNSWNSVINVCEFDCFANHYGVYFNEAMYYVVYKEDDFHLRRKFIAKFDFRTDTLLPLECPNFDDKFSDTLVFNLSVLDECLCLLVSYFPEGTFPEVEIGEEDCPLIRADLWMMKDEGWVRLFSIRDPKGIGIEREICSVVCAKDGSGRRILLEVDGSKIGWYDLDKGLFETIVSCGLPESWVNSGFCCISGSLVSLELEGKRFMTKKEKKKEMKKRYKDNFLSAGFKLKL